MKIKKGRVVLDSLDWKILKVLQENARLSYTEIGKRLNVAHSTVYDRLRKLERFGVIKKYTVVVNLEKLGVKNLTALVTVFVNPKEIDRVASKLAELDEVLEVSISLSEELLVITKVVAKDREELHSFIASSIAPLPGVLRIRTSIITKKYKEENFRLMK